MQIQVFSGLSTPSPGKTKILTTYWIVTKLKMVSMRPPIPNFKSISQFWQHCSTVKWTFGKNPPPPTVLERKTWIFFYRPTIKLWWASRRWIFDYHPGSFLKNSKFLSVDFSIQFWLLDVLKKLWYANSIIGRLKDLSDLVVSVPAKFEGCAAKIVGVVDFSA